MSENLFERIDGASGQANAVRAYLTMWAGIEPSYKKDGIGYQARPTVHRWHNLREQGYVIMMRSQAHDRQINIAFFEHRNSDEICAIEWEQVTLNPPTIDTAKFSGVYKDKYDVSHLETVGHPMEMAEWIKDRLTAFWLLTEKKAKAS